MAKNTWPANRFERPRRMAVRSQRTPADDVTEEQYRQGWVLISTGHSIGQILAATGMTRPQLDYLTRLGHPKLALPSYTAQLAEISAQVRKRAMEAANEIGTGALEALKREVQLAKVASTLAAQLVQAHIQHVVLPAQRDLQSGKLTQDAADEKVARMSLPKSMVESLKALKDYARLESTARMFRTVFDSPHQAAAQLAGQQVARIDLSAEAALPAAFAIVEDVSGGADPTGLDPLDLMPSEWSGWSLEEIETFLTTGELPAHAFGDDREVDELPDECLDQEAGDV